jgi:hypothetical protein
VNTPPAIAARQVTKNRWNEFENRREDRRRQQEIRDQDDRFDNPFGKPRAVVNLPAKDVITVDKTRDTSSRNAAARTIFYTKKRVRQSGLS